MKIAGIVRRLDDLGRIVIPKEVRRIIKAKKGEAFEIFVDREGEIILKRYSELDCLGEHAKACVDSLFEITGYVSYITDRDKIIAVSGISKRELLNKEVDFLIIEVIESKKEKFINEFDPITNFFIRIIVPILVHGDCVGTIILASKDESVIMGELELKLLQISAKYLEKILED